MGYLIITSFMAFCLVVAESTCGRLNTVDLSPETDDPWYNNDHTTAPDKTETVEYDSTPNYGDYDDTVTLDHLSLEELQEYVRPLVEQKGTVKGRYVYTDKSDRSITVLFVAGLTSAFPENA